MKNLYPYLFEPNLHTVVWGGNRLRPFKGLSPTDEPIGESWEVSAVPGSVGIISNGLLAGRDLVSVINEAPEDILGKSVSENYHRQSPLLVKFIDAKRNLSIQVHPNDEMAQREHGKMGKSEMWYVIDAVDVFYLPAGRVHAICGGILLAEVQQSSDVTYRIFDYNRPGMDGKPRELHTELAAQALNYKVEDEYRTDYMDEQNRSNLVIDSPYFSVRVTELTRPFHRNLLKYDSFVISMCLQGDCLLKMRADGQEVILREGHSCLIPAAIADYDIVPLKFRARVLDAFIDNMDRSMAGIVTRFLHLTQK